MPNIIQQRVGNTGHWVHEEITMVTTLMHECSDRRATIGPFCSLQDKRDELAVMMNDEFSSN